MHRTLGDGYIEVNGKRLYADEDLGTGRDATQVRHEEMNALQEEICNVVEAEGFSLNSPSESVNSMIQLNTAINNKLKSGRIQNQSSVIGSNVTDALNNIKTTNDTQQTTIDLHTSQIVAIQGDVGTVSGGTLQAQITTEKNRNDQQDIDIADLDAKIDLLDDVSAVKGDAFIFDTTDNKWHPGSTQNFRSRIQVDSVNDGRADSWSSDKYAKFSFTGIEIVLKGKYAPADDVNVPQGNTSFASYTIPTNDIEAWHVVAIYRGYDWRISGNFVVRMPATIIGYNGYVTNVFQAMQVTFTGAGITLWYDHHATGCGRTMAPYKRFANVDDNINYAGDASGYYICTPMHNGIWLGDNDHWFYRFTRANARTMPGIFTPNKKYAISFDVQAPAYTNIIEYPS